MRTSFALILACIAGLCLGVWLQRVIRRLSERRRARAYNQRGQRAERDAAQLLESNGYTVVARQQRTTYTVAIGGDTHQVPLIVDYVVEHRGEQIAAEVKSSATASRLEHAETRRQLLEYQLALGSRRVLLVDPVRGRISEVAFPIAHAGAPSRVRTPLLFAGALLAMLSAASFWLLAR